MQSNRKEKFIHLANQRVNRALKILQLIGNLSNRSNYDYSEAEVEKIFGALSREIKEARERFRSNGKAEKGKFQLKTGRETSEKSEK